MPTSAECFDLLAFAHDESDVSHSSAVAKALARIPASGSQLVALGWNFTAEALALLEERGAIIFRLSEFPWTDESHENIKVFSASKVKRPWCLPKQIAAGDLRRRTRLSNGVRAQEVMPRFHIHDAFAIENRSLFVLAGSVLDGVIRPGMSISVPFNSSVSITARIDAIEFARHPNGREDTCLCIRCADRAELATWREFNLRDEFVEVTDANA
jgi:hypothetical protein